MPVGAANPLNAPNSICCLLGSPLGSRSLYPHILLAFTAQPPPPKKKKNTQNQFRSQRGQSHTNASGRRIWPRVATARQRPTKIQAWTTQSQGLGRIFFQWLCVKQKMFGAKSQCFLAATWNRSFPMLNLQPVAHLLMLHHVACFHFVSFAHTGV